MKRRQELLVNKPKLKVIEDFGHHPTAIAETLRVCRESGALDWSLGIGS